MIKSKTLRYTLTSWNCQWRKYGMKYTHVNHLFLFHNQGPLACWEMDADSTLESNFAVTENTQATKVQCRGVCFVTHDQRTSSESLYSKCTVWTNNCYNRLIEFYDNKHLGHKYHQTPTLSSAYITKTRAIITEKEKTCFPLILCSAMKGFQIMIFKFS